MTGSAGIVAQICNLLYRRFAIGRASGYSKAAVVTGRSAECNSAIQQIGNLRYSFAAVPDTFNPPPFHSTLDPLLCLIKIYQLVDLV